MLHGFIPFNPSNFTIEGMPNLTGKVALVTGGNSGIGFQTVLQLAKKNAKVYLGARSKAKAEAAIEQMKQEGGEKLDIIFLEMDLQDLTSVKKAAEKVIVKEKFLNILINNAGIMACPHSLSKDGVEIQFATNHLGHFLLTVTLLPLLLKSPTKPRIVNLSSIAHLTAPSVGIYDLKEMNDENTMNTGTRYGQSKLANILFSKALDERYGDKIIVNSCHPGWVNTELVQGVYQSNYIMGTITYCLNQIFAISTLKGAMTSLYLATSPEVEEKDIRSKYYVPLATPLEASAQAQDHDLSEKLWKISEEIIKEKKI